LFVYDIPNTVHVLDLAIVLPLMIATGALLLRGHPVAPVLAAVCCPAAGGRYECRPLHLGRMVPMVRAV
jgi:hypothetical protein